LEHFDTIHNSPSQIYHSALPFSPSSSWLHKYYAVELSGVVKVVKGFPAGWGACSRTVNLNSLPLALACWKDTLAVALESHDILLLSAITGSQVAVLSGHTDEVGSLTFSPDGTSLVSGSNDETIKLWDIQTGGVVKTFHGHTDGVHSVSISPDHTTIASGSEDETIRLWDIQTGECHCIIEQQGQVDYVIFSPANPQHLISASGGYIWKWDINGHQIGPTHKGTHAAFSPDGTHFISCEENVSTVQNSDSRITVAECQIPNHDPNPPFSHDFVDCCFSPNGRLVAIATESFIYVWDITGSDPLLVEAFIGDTGSFSSLTFSSPSTIISASHSNSVKFWQIGGLSTSLGVGDLKSTPPTSGPILSVSLQAENGIAISSDEGGMLRTWDLSTGLCRTSLCTPAKNTHFRDTQMIDGRLTIVWLEDEGICIWDTDKEEPLQMVVVDWGESMGLKISGDGSKVFLHTGKFIEAWSIQTGAAVGKVEVGDDLLWGSLCVDGSRMWVSFKDKPTQGWDFGVSDSPPALLSNTSLERPHLNFIWGMDVGPSRIEDRVTGKKVFQLPGRYAMPWHEKWDGQYLAAGYHSGEVLILDFCDVCPK
jgi:WD40 repeat protein